VKGLGAAAKPFKEARSILRGRRTKIFHGSVQGTSSIHASFFIFLLIGGKIVALV
jgi:hypothetical protein